MIKLILIVGIVFIGLSSNAQEINSRIDARFGIGTSFFQPPERFTLIFENEVNVRLNRYFALSGGVAFGKRDYGINEAASFIKMVSFTQINTNIYISPFKNNRRNDFRLGTGLSRLWMSEVDQYQQTSQGGQVFGSYRIDKRSAYGFSIIIENTYLITEKFLLGLKLFAQSYVQDSNAGIMLKLGAKI